MVRFKIGSGLVGWFALQVLVGCGDSARAGDGIAGASGNAGSAGGVAVAGGAGVAAQGNQQGGGAGAPRGTGGTAPAGAAGSAGAPQGGTGDGLAGQGGIGGQSAEPVDTIPPDSVSLPETGWYNAASSFACAQVSNVEPEASVYYELTLDGSQPLEPTPIASTKLDASGKICGINQNGVTKIQVRQVDAAGNAGPVSLYQYTLDTSVPTICTASASPDDVAYVDAPVHLRLSAEKDGTATIDVEGVGSVVLGDRGINGDTHANDGIYEADYVVPPGSDVANATLTAHFADAAKNPAVDYVLRKKLYIDRTPTTVAGSFVDDAVWTPAGNPYVVTATAAFDANLSLQPGVVVIFKGTAKLTALRAFSALGTPSQPIIMHNATLQLNRSSTAQSFDPVTGDYAAGSRLDFVRMRDGRLTLGVSNAAGAYITNSEIGTLNGYNSSFSPTYGVYVARSWIGTIADHLQLPGSRITRSYVDNASVYGSASNAELSYNQIRKLDIYGWNAGFSLSHCNIGEMKLVPSASDAASFHQNNLGPSSVQTLVITSGSAAYPHIDASANYWGTDTTSQMTSLGSKANISDIFDFYDDPTQSRVDYENWLTAPAVAGPDWVRIERTSPTICTPGGGSGGSGGSGSSGGNGGSGGPGGSGGSGGSGGTGSGSGGTGSGGTGGSGGSGGLSNNQLLGACNNLAGKFCEEITGPAAQLSAMQNSCTSTWQNTCETANLIGSCSFVHGAAALGLTGVLRYYEGGLATAAQLKESCETGLAGTWTAN